MQYLQEKKDPDAVDIFFLHTIELFKCAAERAEREGQVENAHKCRLMCIDAHKLRLVALKSVDRDAIDCANLYINDLLRRFPFDGRFWFQSAIFQFTFQETGSSSDGTEKPIKSFKAIESISRAILARDYPINSSSVASLISKRITVDFGNTLLDLALKDFQDFALKDLQTWSFVKYLQSFSECVQLDPSELAALLLFVLALFRLTNNSFHLKMFFETLLSSTGAKNQTIQEFWPFTVLCLLKLSASTDFKPSDAIWFSIFQHLKAEGSFLSNPQSSLISSSNFESFFIGTFLEDAVEAVEEDVEDAEVEDEEETIQTYDRNPNAFDYNFNEEFSIERDNVISKILEYFQSKNTDKCSFKQFITVRPTDGTLRLGSHFCQQDSSSEDERQLEDVQTANPRTTRTFNELNDSIEELRVKLKLAALNQQPSQSSKPIDFLNNLFIVDTNVLLSGSSVIRTELSNHPERFLVPLIVISEIFKLKDSLPLAPLQSQSQTVYAQNAWEFLEPLLKTASLQVYNSYGRLLRPQEITQQLAILSLTRTQAINDDQIILLASQYHQNFPASPKPILLSEDLNMKLKAKIKGIVSISAKEFRNICNC